MTEIFARVVAVVAEVMAAEPARISRGTRISEDLRADSLDQVEIVIALEEEFGVEIDDDLAARSLATVGELADYVAGPLAAKAEAELAAEGAA